MLSASFILKRAELISSLMLKGACVSHTHKAVLLSTCIPLYCMTGIKGNNTGAVVEPHTHFTVHRKFKSSPAVDTELVTLRSLYSEMNLTETHNS